MMTDLTGKLTEEEKWEVGRYVEFLHPERGLRVGRVLHSFEKGQKKDMVALSLFNPYTGLYGNRGGFRGYACTVEKSRVLRFHAKSRSAREDREANR